MVTGDDCILGWVDPTHQDTMDMANVIGFWPAAAVFLFLIAHLGGFNNIVMIHADETQCSKPWLYPGNWGDYITQLYRDYNKRLQKDPYEPANQYNELSSLF